MVKKLNPQLKKKKTQFSFSIKDHFLNPKSEKGKQKNLLQQQFPRSMANLSNFEAENEN